MRAQRIADQQQAIERELTAERAAALLRISRTLIASGLPAMFGLTVYGSIAQADVTGAIPFRSAASPLKVDMH